MSLIGNLVAAMDLLGHANVVSFEHERLRAELTDRLTTTPDSTDDEGVLA